jgi:hypothetical protein
MRKNMKRLLFGLPFLFTAATLLAQTTTDTPAELSGAAAAGILGGVCIFYLIMIAIWLFLAIWIMRDAKKRQSPNATLVTILGWIPMTTIIGLIVHLVTRPKTIPGQPNP